MRVRSLLPFVLLASVAVASAGDRKRVALAAEWPEADLSAHDTVFVPDARMTDPLADERKVRGLVESAERRLANYVAYSVDREPYPNVLRREPREGEAGVVVRIEIPEYKPGSQAARFWVGFGAGQARLDLDVTIEDAATGEALVEMSKEKGFGWGGIYGGTRSITTMEQKVARSLGAWLSLSHGLDEKVVLERMKNPPLVGPPDRPHATIRIIRPQGAVGAASTWRMGVDDTSIGESHRLEYHVVYVAPGEHFVWLGSDKKRKGKHVTLAAGEEAWFMAMGMKPIDAETGRKKLDKCSLAWEIDLTDEP